MLVYERVNKEGERGEKEKERERERERKEFTNADQG